MNSTKTTMLRFLGLMSTRSYITHLVEPVRSMSTYPSTIPNKISKHIIWDQFYLTNSTVDENKWNDFYYDIDYPILTSKHIKAAINEFNGFIDSHLKEDQLILIQFKIIGKDDQYKSISFLQTTNKAKLQELSDIFIAFLQHRSEEYHVTLVETICLTFKIILASDNDALLSKTVKHVTVEDLNKVKEFKFHGFNLPNSIDFTEWPDCEVEWLNEDCTEAVVYKLDADIEYHVSLFDDHSRVQLISKEQVIFEFEDYIGRVGDLYNFKRIVKNQVYYYIENDLVMKTIERPTKFMTQGRKSAFRSNKLITMDIETRRNTNNVLVPYCICLYDGVTSQSF